MKRTVMCMNNASVVCFALSSASLLLIPLLDLSDGLPKSAYWIAGVFWVGLAAGVLLQIMTARRSGRADGQTRHGERRMLIAAAVFALLLAVILYCRPKNIVLVTADLALLLMSVELYFYLRRRNRI